MTFGHRAVLPSPFSRQRRANRFETSRTGTQTLNVQRRTSCHVLISVCHIWVWGMEGREFLERAVLDWDSADLSRSVASLG